MPTKSLERSISEALLLFFESCDMPMEEAPSHLVDAIREDLEPALMQYRAGSINHKAVGEAIWGTAIYVLRDISTEETERYASLVYGSLGSCGHLDR
jgi:hypothetical protein